MELYTWTELKEKYGWSVLSSKTPMEKIQYAKSRGIILELQERDPNKIKPRLKFKILEEFNYYTRNQLINKYKLEISESTKDLIRYCNKRGIIIEKLGLVDGISTYRIINDDNYIWENEIWKQVEGTSLKVSNLGRVKSKTNQIKAQRELQGYLYVTDGIYKKTWRVHRLILLAFNPIDNSKDFDVDHINGVKTDNRLENLRWVSVKENLKFRDKNQVQIGALVSDLIQEYGYNAILNYLLAYKKKGE